MIELRIRHRRPKGITIDGQAKSMILMADSHIDVSDVGTVKALHKAIKHKAIKDKDLRGP